MGLAGDLMEKRNKNKRTEPLWKGPEADHKLGGITFSALSRFMTCPERFRITMIEGLRPIDDFNHRIEYGNFWHVCEEYFAKGESWKEPLVKHVKETYTKHPMSRDQILHWQKVCEVQFAEYVRFWKKHPDMTKRRPLLSEFTFKVPYKLPSGRVVYLRGKWDSVDLVGEGSKARIWLMENKTKGDVYRPKLERQLKWDMQTMMYLVALYEAKSDTAIKTPLWQVAELPIEGVRYNVVRRALSGGKGSITRGKGTKGSKCSKCKGGTIVASAEWKKCPKCGGAGRVNAEPPETAEHFYARLADVIREDSDSKEPSFFSRWNVKVTKQEVERFKQRFLNPTLERLCDWYDWISLSMKEGRDPFVPRKVNASPGDQLPITDIGYNLLHWQHPFGCANILDEGGSTDTDEYLTTGSLVGLKRVDTLFSELT